jgi:hypothetical protein
MQQMIAPGMAFYWCGLAAHRQSLRDHPPAGERAARPASHLPQGSGRIDPAEGH